MNATSIVVHGTVKPDGTLELAHKLSLQPGPVEVVLTPLPKPGSAGETWWQYLQRARAELEVAGHHFSTGEEVDRHIEELRSGDERIDDIHRQVEESRRQHSQGRTC
jgi:hypothetical protein